MNNWYKNLTKQQKIFVYLLALAGPWILALAADSDSLVLLLALYAPLALLVFLQLGSKE